MLVVLDELELTKLVRSRSGDGLQEPALGSAGTRPPSTATGSREARASAVTASNFRSTSSATVVFARRAIPHVFKEQ